MSQTSQTAAEKPACGPTWIRERYQDGTLSEVFTLECPRHGRAATRTFMTCGETRAFCDKADGSGPIGSVNLNELPRIERADSVFAVPPAV